MLPHKGQVMTPTSLTEKLNYLRARSPRTRALYDELVARLRLLEVGTRVPAVGERFPDIVLPDHRGRFRSLQSLLEDGPLVLSFNRGGWCPYCVSELESWHAALPELEAAGGTLAVVTGEICGRSRALADIVGPGPVALCDVDHGVALELGLAFHIGLKMLSEYRDNGIDLEHLYGGIAGILPVPATFVIRPDGIVHYAFVDPEFRGPRGAL